MPARRLPVSALTGTAVLLTLAGCQRPTPGVTLASAGSSVYSEAVQFCRGGKFLTKVNGNECPGTGKAVTVLRARQDDTVGVDVDRALATTGWYVFDTDSQRSYGFEENHHTSIVADFTNRPLAGVIHLEIRQVDHQPKNNQDLPKVIGQWKFQLVVT
jgi:hypothetical protein